MRQSLTHPRTLLWQLFKWRPEVAHFPSALSQWWHRHLPKMTLAMLSLMIVAMVVIFLRTTASEREARAEATAVIDILADLRDVVRTGVDAETGSRGFILTEDPAFLEPYDRARQLWLRDIKRLEGKFELLNEAENALATQRIHALAEKKLVFMNKVVTLTRQGQRDVAIAETKTKYGKLLLDNIRDTVRDLEMKERQKLAQSVSRADNTEYGITATLIGLMLLIIGLAYFSFRQERRASRVALLDQEALLLRQSKEQADLIAQELNHRVKNLFAVILSLITLSARGGTDVPSTVKKIRDRIHALSLAHSVSQGTSGINSVDIRELLSATLAPYRDTRNLISYDGPQLNLPTAAMTPLGLIMHELATNALKYGALSVPEGSVTVNWERRDDAQGAHINLIWTEIGGPVPKTDAAQGFGTSMIEASAQQLNGQVEHHWHAQGLQVTLHFPLA
jgi:two-component sensor histidine kinase